MTRRSRRPPARTASPSQHVTPHACVAATWLVQLSALMPYVAIPPSTRNTTYMDRPGLRETAEWDWLSEPMHSRRASIRRRNLVGYLSLTQPTFRRLSRTFEKVLRGLASDLLTIPTFRPRGLSGTRTGPPDLREHTKIHAYLPSCRNVYFDLYAYMKVYTTSIRRGREAHSQHRSNVP